MNAVQTPEPPEAVARASLARSCGLCRHAQAWRSVCCASQVGAQVMCLKNLDFASGLVNGARGVVVALVSNGTQTAQGTAQLLPQIKFVCGETRVMGKEVWSVYEGDKVRMPRATCRPTYQVHLCVLQACAISRFGS